MSQVHQPISRKRIYIIFLFMDLLTAIERYYLFPGNGWFFHVSLFIATFLVVMILWEYLLLISRLLDKKLPVASQPVLRIVAQVMLCFALLLLLGYGLFNTAEIYFNVKTPDALDKIMPLLFFLMSIIINLIYFGTYYFREWKENLLRSERLQREQAQVKYDALRNQLNPHFLFNALTSLNSLIFDNQQLASDFLQQLSKVYRYTLQNKDKETVSLRTELDFIKNYIFLFKTRFGDAIDFKINLSEEAQEKGIVPVTLQMLIENAAKHNIITDENPLIVSIYNDGSFLYVENTINKKSQVETSNRQGLENLKALYRYLSDLPVEIIDTGKIFTVKIPLL